MEYLNDLHKQSIERSIKAINEYQKHPMPSKEAAKKAFDMHKRLAEQSQE